ncbi:MAG: hypothetical protein LBM59_02915 [Ruminococcus sp.]|jgi:hypothetical protein|nr:hypothetical protein [Ruminococcus sp.]
MSKLTFLNPGEVDNPFFRAELESVLKDPAARSYLDGLFNMIRNIVGHTTAMDDFILSELKKDNPDFPKIKKTLIENETRLMGYLGSITDAHHLLSALDNPDREGDINVSETLTDISEKFSRLFGRNIEVRSTIEKDVFATIDKVSFEIAVSDYVEHLLNADNPPARLDIGLKLLSETRAELAVKSYPGGKYSIPPRTETEAAVHTSDFTGIFLENFLHALEGTLRFENQPDGENVVILEFAVKPPDKLRLNSREVVFEFDNIRFSPAAAKLTKYFKKLTFR